MKHLQEYVQENLQINEAHDPFFLTGKISQYLCEVRDREEVKEILTCVANGLKNGLNKRKNQLSSEKEANEYIENVFNTMMSAIESK